jgi:hypothetical protein
MKMKLRNLAKMGVVALSIAAASTAFASKGTQKNEAFKVKIKLITPLTITETAEMDFGTYVSGDDTGAKALGHANGAKFNITGAVNYSVTVSLADSATVMKKDGTGSTAATQITANAFEIWQTGGAQIGTTFAGGSISLGGTGTISVEVGGTATLAADDVAGDYYENNTLQVIYD